MMTIEIRINGKPIRTLSVYNVAQTVGDCLADYEVMEGGEFIARIECYDRRKGAEFLASEILKKVTRPYREAK